MDRTTELRLIDECLDGMAQSSPPAEGAEREVPVDFYLDPDRFEQEKLHIHRRALNLVAHVSEIAEPGAFRTVDVVGTPVLLTRDQEGRARAFVNVCRHRGATVELRDRGQCKRFVCPYHAWTYGTDGRLEHLRHADGFPSLDRAQVSLRELACVERAPFIWVCPDPALSPTLDPHAAALADEIAAIDGGRLSLFARETKVWRGNWKLFVEGGIESYHFKIAHRSTIAKLFTDTRSTFEVFGRHLRSVLPKLSMNELRDRPRETWKLVEHANVLYNFDPNASILVQDGHYAVITMSPVSVDETRIDVWTLGRRVPEGEAGDKVRAFLEANHRFTHETLKEDFVLGEQIQRGLGTGANASLRLATFEGALAAWHDTLAARVAP